MVGIFPLQIRKGRRGPEEDRSRHRHINSHMLSISHIMRSYFFLQVYASFLSQPFSLEGCGLFVEKPVYLIPILTWHIGHIIVDVLEPLYYMMIEEYGGKAQIRVHIYRCLQTHIYKCMHIYEHICEY